MKARIWILGLCVVGMACQPVRIVREQQLGRVDIDKYETFAFAQIGKEVKVNQVNTEKTEEYVRRQVIEQLESAGYIYQEEDPDLWVDMDLLLRNVKQQNNNNTFYPNYGYGWRRRYYYNNDPAFWGEDLRYGSFTEARIKLEIAGVREERLLWEGTAEARLPNNPEKGLLRINSAVDMLVAELTDTSK